jgi:hypothetical protein
MIFSTRLLIFLIVLLLPVFTHGQPPPGGGGDPGGGQPVPIGGIEILLAAGIALGLKKFGAKRKES